MIESLSTILGGLSPAALVALLVVVVVQCGFQLFCIVDLIRRRAVTGGHKWLWALIIVAGGLLGALVYFALGRAAGSASSDAGAGGADATRRAIDRLYGDNK